MIIFNSPINDRQYNKQHRKKKKKSLYFDNIHRLSSTCNIILSILKYFIFYAKMTVWSYVANMQFVQFFYFCF